MLLHTGYSKEDNGERATIFCLTNGTSKPIAFSGSTPGGPVWLKEVKTASGWVSPRGWHISAGRLQTCVLRPGQSVSFLAWSSQNSSVWRAAVKYWPCEIRPSQSTTSGNTFLGFVASRGFRDSDAQPFPGAVVACDRPLMRGVQAKLPKLTPAWLKRYVDSKARDPVARGPEMKSGREGT